MCSIARSDSGLSWFGPQPWTGAPTRDKPSHPANAHSSGQPMMSLAGGDFSSPLPVSSRPALGLPEQAGPIDPKNPAAQACHSGEALS